MSNHLSECQTFRKLHEVARRVARSWILREGSGFASERRLLEKIAPVQYGEKMTQYSRPLPRGRLPYDDLQR